MRTPKLGLLPAAVAAAAVTAVAVPASAAEAPPPVPRTYTLNDCPEALNFLTSLLNSLLKSPDLTRAVCTTRAEQNSQDAPGAADGWDTKGTEGAEGAEGAETAPVEGTYTAPDGRTAAQDDAKLLGLVEMPKSLTVTVPTLDEGTYTYTAGGR
ncbi:hypothetical protein HUT06_31445 [Actinomadura sp. NAK00032]|uniref:hypothetical protein n=1 Tax=Actinomadura sp. NAK00032 TaxID=2742128 RepID=UPI001591A972|nr:hypothetical protein [Actinomadura sp. NAK00032]QKW37962.1 hypothetical protein HUT06_31445 [Actinomadura sp. NAK00032]